MPIWRLKEKQKSIFQRMPTMGPWKDLEDIRIAMISLGQMKKQPSRRKRKLGRRAGKQEPVASSAKKKAFGGLKEITLDRIVVRAKF